jgi:hypothetical protein
MKRRALALALGSIVGLLAGCVVKPPPEPKNPPVPLGQLVTEHNATASRVDKIWANAEISIRMPVEGRMVSWTFSSGVLLMGKGPNKLGPHDYVLVGREGGKEVFRLGSSTEENVYYLWVSQGEKGQLWRGRLDLAGAEGVDIPVDPTQLVAVLNIVELPSDLSTLPTVALTMQGARPRLEGGFDPYTYVLTYIDRQPVSNKIVFRREILFPWADDKARQAYQINFLNPQGRRVMIATLKNYKAIDMGEGADSKSPVLMPTDIEVVWPDKDGRIHIVLSGMTTTKGEPVEASKLTPPEGIPQKVVDEFLKTGGSK